MKDFSNKLHYRTYKITATILYSLQFISKFIVFSYSLLLYTIFTGTMGKRLSNIGVENSEDNRRFYRQLLFKVSKVVVHHTVERKNFFKSNCKIIVGYCRVNIIHVTEIGM